MTPATPPTPAAPEPAEASIERRLTKLEEQVIETRMHEATCPVRRAQVQGGSTSSATCDCWLAGEG